jgi:DNA-binding NarL/FixJ family response regulator
VRVVVADSNRANRYGVKVTLRGHDFAIVGEAEGAADAIRLAHELRPDILLLELRLAGLSGLHVIRAVAPVLPEVKIVAFSNEVRLRADAIAAGATSFVTKDAPEYELVAEMCRVGSDSARAKAALRTGEYLVMRELISFAQLEAALAWQRELREQGRPHKLGELLTQIGAVSESEREAALGVRGG